MYKYHIANLSTVYTGRSRLDNHTPRAMARPPPWVLGRERRLQGLCTTVQRNAAAAAKPAWNDCCALPESRLGLREVYRRRQQGGAAASPAAAAAAAAAAVSTALVLRRPQSAGARTQQQQQQQHAGGGAASGGSGGAASTAARARPQSASVRRGGGMGGDVSTAQWQRSGSGGGTGSGGGGGGSGSGSGSGCDAGGCSGGGGDGRHSGSGRGGGGGGDEGSGNASADDLKTAAGTCNAAPTAAAPAETPQAQQQQSQQHGDARCAGNVDGVSGSSAEGGDSAALLAQAYQISAEQYGVYRAFTELLASLDPVRQTQLLEDAYRDAQEYTCLKDYTGVVFPSK
ncbi:hypothetical protein JKP88DRAFT_254408 [Tribonema minus]|uniref:Uncharacterized protein n=1 Tax=Tribonema minus TaxID=303371 RepID=A0A836CIN9_9STRA|nr:hypothetical protein JKP88DRAFT_254408 [Tribonema minus]